jgi:hypothetical protein
MGPTGVSPEHLRRFEFVEQVTEPAFGEESGLKDFLLDPSLCNGATQQEIEFLKNLRFQAKRPTALYYYRELQIQAMMPQTESSWPMSLATNLIGKECRFRTITFTWELTLPMVGQLDNGDRVVQFVDDVYSLRRRIYRHSARGLPYRHSFLDSKG